MKAYPCSGCPKTETFIPATAPRGTLMLDEDGFLYARTDLKWGVLGCIVSLSGHSPGTSYTGGGPFTKATEPWCLEND